MKAGSAASSKRALAFLLLRRSGLRTFYVGAVDELLLRRLQALLESRLERRVAASPCGERLGAWTRLPAVVASALATHPLYVANRQRMADAAFGRAEGK